MLSRILLIFLITLTLPSSTSAQVLQKSSTLIKVLKSLEAVEPDIAPSSNSMTDITINRDTVWIGVGNGLNRAVNTFDNSWNLWFNFNSDNTEGFGRGGSATTHFDGRSIWIATVTDTFISTLSAQVLPVGTGISYSPDGGDNWTHIPQPKLSAADSFLIRGNGDRIPIVTDTVSTVLKTSFDLFATDSVIWLASLYGGTERSNDGGSTFFPVFLPPDNLTEVHPDSFYGGDAIYSPEVNVGGSENYISYSVTVGQDGTVWVGTLRGINRSTDGGTGWKKFTSQNANITGSFCIAIEEQVYEEMEGGNPVTKSVIWAGTRENGSGEINGVSITEDGGETWRPVLLNVQVLNFGFDGKTAYAATLDKGVFRTRDLGENWENFLFTYDAETGDHNKTPEFFSVGVQTNEAGTVKSILFGGPDGLSVSNDDGFTWKRVIAFRPTAVDKTPKTYPAPNPFSLQDDAFVRFHYNTRGHDQPAMVTVRIYDYAMDLVTTLVKDKVRQPGGDFSELWNGRNGNGTIVANGTYIYTIKIGKKNVWGKVTVLN